MKKRLLVIGMLACITIAPSYGQEKAKMTELKEKMTDVAKATPALKTLDADNKKLAVSFGELLKKNGYTPQGLTCEPSCTVSCTWVNGQCQATTSCTVTCH